MRPGLLLTAGTVLLALGLALAFLGILTAPLFLPGTWLILLGLLACAGAGVLALLAPSPPHEPVS